MLLFEKRRLHHHKGSLQTPQPVRWGLWEHTYFFTPSKQVVMQQIPHPGAGPGGPEQPTSWWIQCNPSRGLGKMSPLRCLSRSARGGLVRGQAWISCIPSGSSEGAPASEGSPYAHGQQREQTLEAPAPRSPGTPSLAWGRRSRRCRAEGGPGAQRPFEGSQHLPWKGSRTRSWQSASKCLWKSP